MAKSNGILFILFLSFFTIAISPAQGMTLWLANADGSQEESHKIVSILLEDRRNLFKTHRGLFKLKFETVAVYCYVVSYAKFKNLMVPTLNDAEFNVPKCELFYVGVQDSDGSLNNNIIEESIKHFVSGGLHKDFVIYVKVDDSLKTINFSDNFEVRDHDSGKKSLILKSSN